MVMILIMGRLYQFFFVDVGKTETKKTKNQRNVQITSGFCMLTGSRSQISGIIRLF